MSLAISDLLEMETDKIAKIINKLFAYTELDNEPCGCSIEDGYEHVMHAPAREAVRIATKIVSDPAAAELVYGGLNKLLHDRLIAADVMGVLDTVCKRNFLLSVVGADNMQNPYMLCLSYPDSVIKQLHMPVLLFNENTQNQQITLTSKCTSWCASC